MSISDLRQVDSRPFPVEHLIMQLLGPHLAKTRANPMTPRVDASLPGLPRGYVADVSDLWYFWPPGHLKAKYVRKDLAICPLQAPS